MKIKLNAIKDELDAHELQTLLANFDKENTLKAINQTIKDNVGYAKDYNVGYKKILLALNKFIEDNPKLRKEVIKVFKDNDWTYDNVVTKGFDILKKYLPEEKLAKCKLDFIEYYDLTIENKDEY